MYNRVRISLGNQSQQGQAPWVPAARVTIRAEEEELKDLRLCCQEQRHKEHTECIPEVKIMWKIVLI